MRRFLLMPIVMLVLAPAARAWTWPVDGAVLQPFSFDSAHPYAGGQHRAIEVAGSLGAVVRAPAAGVVAFAGTVPVSGHSVTIQTADGWSVTLTHLGSVAVDEGATVAEGDGVGTIGPSTKPDVSQPFVELGVRATSDDQGYVDPLGFLPAQPVAAPPADAATAGLDAPAPPAAATPAPGPVSPAAAVSAAPP